MYLGLDPNRKPIWINANDLLTHGVVLGRTGSGKTGLMVSILEEVATSGSHAIVLDPKGDLTNLALHLHTVEQFAQWVEPGTSPAEAFARHEAGLAGFGLEPIHTLGWTVEGDTTVFTPGSLHGGGRRINVFPTFMPPRSTIRLSAQEQASRGVATVLQALKAGDDPYDPALIFLTEAVLDAWRTGKRLPVEAWPGVLTNPPPSLNRFGGMPMEDFFPKRGRLALARKLIGFQHQAERWLTGETLDLHRLMDRPKPLITVFSMRHLSEDDRMFFTSIVMQHLVEFMFETSSSQKLKLLCVLDEARGYLPPHPYNPPTKGPIGTLLAQGRAQGVGMLIGTQNPMDLDYKALSNVGTWFIGRLRERDCARDLATELRNRNVDIATLENMPQRNFLVLDKHGQHHQLNVRWCYHYLRGPLDANEIARLDELELVAAPGRTIKVSHEKYAELTGSSVQVVKADPATAPTVLGKIIKFCRGAG